MTRAPAAVAWSAVLSCEPPSTTMTSLTPRASTQVTTCAIAASSSRHGMTAETTAGRRAAGRGAALWCATSLTDSSAVPHWRRRRAADREGELFRNFEIQDRYTHHAQV